MKNYFNLFIRFLFVFISALLLNYSCKDNSCPTEDSREKIEITLDTFKVAYEIIPVMSDGVYNLAYEVDLSNFQFNSYILVKAEAIDASTNKVLRCIEGEELSRQLKSASEPLPTNQEIMEGTTKLPNPRVMYWIRVAPSNLLTAIKHRFTFKKEKDDFKLYVANGAYKTISTLQPIKIGPPFLGSGWYPIETTAEDTHHFFGVYTIGGAIKGGQRFAVDWIQMDSTKTNFHKGDGISNEDWYCYGVDLIAVGDGVISAVHDGVQDNYPVGTINTLTNEDIAGNYVMLKLADRQYAVYGHMIPGSIKVKVGDIVKKGDVLGKLGNTGRSDVPHLHFQISDSTSLFDIEGLPYVFSEFELEAYSEMLWAPRFQDISIMNYQPVIPPKKYYNELIERYMIIRFY